MKKSLQRIAFGLSIIAASTGVTQSMQAPMKSMTRVLHIQNNMPLGYSLPDRLILLLSQI